MPIRSAFPTLCCTSVLWAGLLQAQGAAAAGTASLSVAGVLPAPVPQIASPGTPIQVHLNTASAAWPGIKSRFVQGRYGLRLTRGKTFLWFIPAGSPVSTGSIPASQISHAIAYNAVTATVTVTPGPLLTNTAYTPKLAAGNGLVALLRADQHLPPPSGSLCCTYGWSMTTAQSSGSGESAVLTSGGSTPVLPLRHGASLTLSAGGAGSGTVNLYSYSADPVGTADAAALPAGTVFFDVSDSPDSTFTSLTLALQSPAGRLWYWTGSTWADVHPQGASANGEAATLTATSAPGIGTLHGTVFAEVPVPTVASISPTTGTSSGGSAVEIHGSGFTGVTGVHFGGAAVAALPGSTQPAFSVISDSAIEVWNAPGGTGSVDVSVTGTSGTSAANAGDTYTYGAAGPQHMGIPSYIYPGPGTAWDTIDTSAPALGLAVINPDSGPGTACNSDYAQQVTATQSRGIAVIGYVYTRYANTQPDSNGTLDRTLAAVERDIDRYYSCYPSLDGIFFDEASTDCRYAVSYYQQLSLYVKARGGRGITAINPGTSTNECYLGAADIIATFEGSATDYAGYTPAPWTDQYPADRFWHIIYSAADVSSMVQMVTLSQQRRAGWVYVTDQGLPNPYGALPEPTYWSDELNAIQPPGPLHLTARLGGRRGRDRDHLTGDHHPLTALYTRVAI